MELCLHSLYVSFFNLLLYSLFIHFLGTVWTNKGILTYWNALPFYGGKQVLSQAPLTCHAPVPLFCVPLIHFHLSEVIMLTYGRFVLICGIKAVR